MPFIGPTLVAFLKESQILVVILITMPFPHAPVIITRCKYFLITSDGVKLPIVIFHPQVSDFSRREVEPRDANGVRRQVASLLET